MSTKFSTHFQQISKISTENPKLIFFATIIPIISNFAENMKTITSSICFQFIKHFEFCCTSSCIRKRIDRREIVHRDRTQLQRCSKYAIQSYDEILLEVSSRSLKHFKWIFYRNTLLTVICIPFMNFNA